jgi:hypothetical protein
MLADACWTELTNEDRSTEDALLARIKELENTLREIARTAELTSRSWTRRLRKRWF